MERRRINLTVRPELYDQLTRLARRYGFRNRCSLVVCILRMMTMQLNVRVDRPDTEETDGDTISDAFGRLGEWERTKHKYGEYGEGHGL